MIPYETLLAEMEKHMILAKQKTSDQQLREHITAIRALCDVVLSTNKTDNLATIQKVEEKSTEKPIIYSNVPSQPLEEDDANGSSIFDF